MNKGLIVVAATVFSMCMTSIIAISTMHLRALLQCWVWRREDIDFCFRCGCRRRTLEAVEKMLERPLTGKEKAAYKKGRRYGVYPSDNNNEKGTTK